MARLVGPRGRVIAQTGAWSIISKACGAANLFLSVPFVLKALGPVQFGAWATLASLVGLVGFLDFGFGNGTMNLIAGARGRNSQDEIATILNESTRALWAIAAGLAVVAVVLLIVIPWHLLLGLPETQSGTSRAAAAAVLGAIVLGVPLNLASRAQLGLGYGDRAFRWTALGQLITLAAVIICARASSSLPLLTAAAIATPLVAALANTLDLHRSYRYRPTNPARHPGVANRIRREGALFFILQITATLSFSLDLPLISALRGAADAGTYAIVQRLFSVIPLGLSLIWVPLWPVYRQALAAGDHRWVIRTLRSTLLIAVTTAAVGGLVLSAGFDRIADIWINHSFTLNGWLLGGFAVWCTLDAAGRGIATFLNAASIVRLQVILAIVFGSICIPGKVWATASYGAFTLPWVAAVTYLLCVIIPYSYFRRRLVVEALAKHY